MRGWSRRSSRGTYKPVANKANDYLVDREMQRGYNYSGINNFPLQDICQIEDQGGPIMDRTRERLTSQDTLKHPHPAPADQTLPGTCRRGLSRRRRTGRSSSRYEAATSRRRRASQRWRS